MVLRVEDNATAVFVIRRRSRPSLRCREIPVVIVPSSDSAADLAAIQQGGATSYFRKPSDLAGFLNLGKLIRQLLGALD